MKIRKIGFALALMTAFLMTSIILPPVRGQGTATLSVSPPETVQSSGPVLIDITVNHVAAMWGYQFMLTFDPTVLSFVGAVPEYPFDNTLPSVIGDGYVVLAYRMPYGELYGFNWDDLYDAFPLLHLEFSIAGAGASQLRLSDTVISDIYGNSITHIANSGVFMTSAGLPVADFTWAPMTPVAEELVTFDASLSSPDVTSWSWSFGGTTQVATTSFAEGTYIVSLTVSNGGASDSYSASIKVNPKPKIGAIATNVHGSGHLLDYSKYGEHKYWLKTNVKNLDTVNPTYVRVAFWVYAAIDNHNFGAIEMPLTWLMPGDQALFQSQFDFLDLKWMLGAYTLEEFTEYLVVSKVQYMDYWLIEPNPELPEGQPHWATWPAPEETFTFWAHETAPVVVTTATETAPLHYVFDQTGTYDPDAKFGDYISQYRWSVYRYTEGVGWSERLRLFQPTIEYQFTAGRYWRVRAFAWDSFGVMSVSPYIYFDYR